MARADIIVAGGLAANFRSGSQSAYKVRTAAADYVFYISGVDNNLYWTRSTDYEITWSDPVIVSSTGAMQGLSVWFDKWTPGNTGDIIHLAYFESNTDDVFYKQLNTATDTLGSEITVFAGASTGSVANTCIAITRAIGGNIYVMFDIDGGTEVGFYRSTDGGGTFGARTGSVEGADYFLLAPGFAADTQDIICIFWDRSASEISRKLHDDSADGWAEASIVTTMTAIASSTASPHFSITVDDPNNKICLIAWNARDTANADLRFWKIDESSITEGTPVVSNGTDDQTLCALAYESVSGDFYAYYGGKSDGSEVVGTAINIYYKISTDDGATWGSETVISQAARNFDLLFTSPIFDDSATVMYQAQATGIDNLLASAVLPSSGGGSANLLAGKL